MSKESIKRGSTVFSSICISCHQAHGRGIKGNIPPLDGSEWLNAKIPGVPVAILLKGIKGPITVNGEKFDSHMPSQGLLSDQQIADVLTYARQQWSNNSSPITVDYVTKVRASLKPKTTPWTAQELKSKMGGKIEKEVLKPASPFSSVIIEKNPQLEVQSEILAGRTEEQAPTAESSLFVLGVLTFAFIKGISKPSNN